MSEKRSSQGSARWTLSNLWRPISNSMLPSSNRSSTGTLPHLSLSIPPFFSRVEDTSPEIDIEKGTHALLSGNQYSRATSEGYDIESSPSDNASTFKSANEDQAQEICPPARVVRLKRADSPFLPGQPSEMSSNRRLSATTISTRTTITKRPESRDTRHLAELPALPPRLRSIKSSRATVLSRTSRPETRDSCPPPVPEKEPKPSTFVDENPHRRTLVVWDGPQDPENAINWPKSRKWAITLALGFVSFCVSLSSSILIPAANEAAMTFAVSEEIMVLPTALFLVGLSLGSPIWAALIDYIGRKVPLFIGLLGFAVLEIPVAVAQNVTTVFVCRFFAGVFGAGSLIAAASSLADIWTSLDRGLAMAVFAAAALIGPSCGPLIGAPITDSSVLSWTWNSWIVVILCFPFGLACVLIYRESSSRILLQRKAKSLRRSTQDWALHAPADEEVDDFRTLMAKHLWRPIKMFVSDSIIFLTTFYTSFTYGVLFLILEIEPKSFTDRRRWPFRLSGLPSAAIIVGICIGCIVNVLFTRLRFAALVKKYGRLFPEERLLPMVVGSAFLPSGLFLVAWTSFTSITPIPEIIGGVLVGVGFLLVFLQGNNYLLDVYSTQATSVIVINTFLRSIFAAGFSVFSRYIYQRLGPHWTYTIFGVVAVVCMPIPIAFFRFGVKLRAMSKWTPKLSSANGSSSVEGFPARRE